MATAAQAGEPAVPQERVALEPQFNASLDSAARDSEVQHRNKLIIGGGAALIGAYGIARWWDTGMTGEFKITNEGWFSKGTKYGGMDKFGHFYSNYGTVRVLTPLFELAGNSRESSLHMAGLSALGIFTGIEFIDGFSRRWRFSPQDTVANLAGITLGLAMETHPHWDEMFDFRIDYRRSSGSRFDPAGDYSGQKYLLVLKADGFEPLRQNKYLRYLEIALGYGAKGFDRINEQHQRNIYFGVSLNLARLLADGAYEGQMHSTPFQRTTDVMFDLVQFPTIGYVRHSID